MIRNYPGYFTHHLRPGTVRKVKDLRTNHETAGQIHRRASRFHILGWPLRRAISFSLEHPVFLEKITRLLSRFPRLFNWALGYAQRNGIVSAAVEDNEALRQIESISELTPEARIIYQNLTEAFRSKKNKKDNANRH